MINLGNIELADLRLGASQVKAAYFGSKQIWGGEEPVPVGDWLCFTAEQANSTLRLDVSYAPSTIYLETSTDGRTWTDYSWTNSTGDTLTLASVGDKVYFRAKTENQTIGSSDTKFYQFVMTGQIAASGNIQTLLKADGSRTDAPAYCYSYMFYDCSALTTAPELPATTLANYCYESMFSYCTSLTTAPALPATTLADYCYENMFSSCTSLTTAPALPATTLANGCYDGMFQDCTSLTTAPELPAMSLASGCYQSMFYGCSSLSSMEVAFTTWSPSGATDTWLNNVAASGTFTCPAALPETRGDSNIPVGWNVVKPAVNALRFDILADDTTIDLVDDSGTLETPDLEYSVDDGATWTQWVPGSDFPHEMAGAVVYVRAGAAGNTGFGTDSRYWHFTSDDLFSVSGNIMYLLSRDGSTGLSNYCFYGLFNGCTMLVDASGLELPATTLANSCYESMFNGCTSLTTAPELPATTLANGCYRIMFRNCSSLSAAPELSATTLATYCYQQMFQNCTSLSAAQTSLPATALSSSCYYSMFDGCSSLTAAPSLPATTLAGSCYGGMFEGCSSLTTAPALPATTLALRCYSSMFQNCTSLTAAPALPATTLANSCYNTMFRNCTSLATAPALPATTLATNCYYTMFYGCSSLSSMEVAFTAWNPSNATTNWLNNVAASGTFTCPAELSDIRDSNHIPTGWTVVKPPSVYPIQDLKLHFDAIDNAGVGNHLSSTQDWANIAPNTSADYKLRRTSGTWEDDSAVFTGAYDECFWLNTTAGSQVNNFSQTGLVLSSQTYEFAFYFDPSTCQNYRGYVGKQSNGITNGQMYIACDSSGQVNLSMSGKTTSESNAEWWSGNNSLNMYPYLTQNAFNTIAITWDEATTVLALYVNGQKIGDSTAPDGITHDTVLKEGLTLGGGMQTSWGNRVCKGKIHDFLIYSRALSDAEVAQLHDYQNARFNS